MRLLILLLSILSATTVYGYGFVGPGSAGVVYQAADALAAADDSPCVLEGHIIAKIQGRKNRYLFTDSSGQLILEIKRKVFGRLTITPATLVRVEGEIDVSDKYPNEIEVDNLTILD